MTLDECTFIYKVLGQKVFSRVVAGKEGKDETWMEVGVGGGDKRKSWVLYLLILICALAFALAVLLPHLPAQDLPRAGGGGGLQTRRQRLR